jgi:hypothetical protein
MPGEGFFRYAAKNHLLVYDHEKSILFCKKSDGESTLWAKKINDITGIESVIEDSQSFYAACGTDEFTGRYLALSKSDGATLWSIPGRSYLHLIHSAGLYIIFIDDNEKFYLIKADCANGNKIWHREVDPDLSEYEFSKGRITLSYSSGAVEVIKADTGKLIS